MKRRLLSVLLLTGFFALPGGLSFACDFCILSQGISPLETLEGSGVRVSERYTLLTSVYRGTEEVSNPGAKEEYWTTEVTAFHAMSEDMTLLAMVPLRKTILDGHLHVHEDGEAEAHGDMRGGGPGSGTRRFSQGTASSSGIPWIRLWPWPALPA